MQQTEIDWDSFLPEDHTADLVASAREHFATLAGEPTKSLDQRSDALERIWPELTEHGYTALGLPEELGGFGSVKDSVAVMEVAGETQLPVPLLLSQVTSHTLAACGLLDDSLVQMRGALLLGGSGSANSGNGRVWDGAGSEYLVTLEAAQPNRTRVVVATVSSPFDIDPQPVDPSRPAATFDEDRLVPHAETELDVPVDRVLALARVLMSADLIGTAQRALNLAVEHAKVREQFGQPIGAFQGVKHALADVHVAVEAARSLTFGAAVSALADPLSHETLLQSTLAKASASEAALNATGQAVQVLGAMGLTRESVAPWLVRRARVTAPFLGDHRHLYAEAGRLVRDKEMTS